MHSLKVASLAKAIAQNQLRLAVDDPTLRARILHWGGLDAHACETAGLAHDIGHPPFGHVAEGVLDDWLKAEINDAAPGRLAGNGFEGNAQSFRAITYLERKKVNSHGLELTAVSLAAVLKYPWARVDGDAKRDAKFGSFDADIAIFDRARGWTTSTGLTNLSQTLEASIMDIADDITYAVHDLQDFIFAGILQVETTKSVLQKMQAYVGEIIFAEEAGREPGPPAAEIKSFVDKLRRLKEFYPSFCKFPEYKAALRDAMRTIDDLNSAKQTSQPFAQARGAGAELIGQLVSSIEIADPSAPDLGDQPRVFLQTQAWHLVQILKDVTKALVVETPRLGLHQASQVESLTELLNKLYNWYETSERVNLPARLVAYLGRSAASGTPEHTKRAIVDFCCSLTDDEAHTMSLRLRGIEVPSIS